MTVRLVVVDDNLLLRAGLVTVLRSDPDLDVVAEADDGPSGVALARQLRPDVVLMDVEMPGGDGITATREIATTAPEVRVLILTMFDLDAYVVDALRAGAAGFLIKTTEPARLIAAVKSCAAGETTVGPTVMARLLDSYLRDEPVPADPELVRRLTPRELEVLRVLTQGCTSSRDRRAALPGRDHGEDPRRAGPGQARRSRPGPGRRAGPPGGVWPGRAAGSGEAFRSPTCP